MLTFALVANARPQDYDDYEQQTARPVALHHKQQQQQHHQQNQKKTKADDRETTTWIPIIQYDKEQGTDGSYKTQ